MNVSNLKEKLGMTFLQLHSNFGPKNMERLVPFFERFPKDIELAIEFQHPSPLLSAYFIEKVNKRFGTALHIPKMYNPKTKF